MVSFLSSISTNARIFRARVSALDTFHHKQTGWGARVAALVLLFRRLSPPVAAEPHPQESPDATDRETLLPTAYTTRSLFRSSPALPSVSRNNVPRLRSEPPLPVALFQCRGFGTPVAQINLPKIIRAPPASNSNQKRGRIPPVVRPTPR